MHGLAYKISKIIARTPIVGGATPFPHSHPAVVPLNVDHKSAPMATVSQSHCVAFAVFMQTELGTLAFRHGELITPARL